MNKEWRAIITEDEEKKKADSLPKWVKCMFCGGRPTYEDLLGEVVKHSNALAHQSCARERGLMFGMNAGSLQEIGNTIKAVEPGGSKPDA